MRRIPRWVRRTLILVLLVVIGVVLYRSAHVQGLQWPIVTTKVVKVVDGDTIEVKIAGKLEEIRLVGINTPETVKRNWPIECYGPEASKRAKELMPVGTTVTLTSDSASGDRDKYHRLLRYITLPDGSDYGLGTVASGYAHEYDYKGQRYSKRKEYQTAQAEARSQHRGLWDPAGCNGKP